MMVPELFTARLILGCVFLASCLGKFSSFSSFADEILDYHLLSKRQAQVVAYLLPFVELLLAVLTLIGIALAPVSIFVIFLLLVFTGAIAINLLRGRRFSCHCFGSSSAMIGPVTLLRNVLLITLALWMFLHAPVLSITSLIALWQDNIQQLAHLEIIFPLVATTVLSLVILFLLGEMDTIFTDMRRTSI